jgi:hypothetical protein
MVGGGALEPLASGGGALLVGYLAGAAAGPAIAAASAASVGVRNGRSWRELRTSASFAAFFSALTVWLACQACVLGSSALALAPAALRVPFGAGMLALLVGVTPITALVAGTIAAPALPYQAEPTDGDAPSARNPRDPPAS